MEVLGCKLGLLPSAVASVLSLEVLASRASGFVGSADTVANEYSSSIPPTRVTRCAELNGGLLLPWTAQTWSTGVSVE